MKWLRSRLRTPAALLGAALSMAASGLLVDVQAAPFIDVEADLGLEPGSNPTADNGALLNTAFSDSTKLYQFIFPGKKFLFTTTMPSPNHTARAFAGNGLHRPSTNDSFGQYLGPATRLVYAGTAFDFDGSTVKATTAVASDTITLVGRSVVAGDAGLVLRITSGTNFKTGTYVVASVDTGANTWTLDRTCTTGAGDEMVGTSAGTLWRDRGFGSVYRGLYFTGRKAWDFQGTDLYTPGGAGGPRAFVGFHMLTNQANLNTGKVTIEQCAFSDCEAGILAGYGMQGAHDKLTSYTGDDYLHADNFAGRQLFFHGCRTCIYARNNQSVKHVWDGITVANSENVFYFERGGQLYARGIEVGGQRGSLLRLGRDSGANTGMYHISGFGFDGSGDNSFKLLEMDPLILSTVLEAPIVILEDGIIDRAIGTYQKPIVEAYAGTKVILNGIKRLQPGSIVCKRSSVGNGRPHVVIMNCMLDGVTNQEDVIDLANSSQGTGDYVVEFFGNTNVDSSIVYDNERYSPP